MTREPSTSHHGRMKAFTSSFPAHTSATSSWMVLWTCWDISYQNYYSGEKRASMFLLVVYTTLPSTIMSRILLWWPLLQKWIGNDLLILHLSLSKKLRLPSLQARLHLQLLQLWNQLLQQVQLQLQSFHQGHLVFQLIMLMYLSPWFLLLQRARAKVKKGMGGCWNVPS